MPLTLVAGWLAAWLMFPRMPWSEMASAVALLAGSASALFLLSLDHATQWRATHRWAIWLLPLAGFAVGGYHLFGRPVNAAITY
ncbi:hypothetical protein [Pseudomonas sp. LM20]|uniref:hypothetical protein n=1 Tax=Pseudomonas sp. LM20 TaxID=2899116 RepID=UPI003FA3ADA9